MSWRRWLIAAMTSTAAISVQPAFAQTAEPAPPAVGTMKPLGQDRYQIGQIVVDKRAAPLHRARPRARARQAARISGHQSGRAEGLRSAAGARRQRQRIQPGLHPDRARARHQGARQQAARRGQCGRPARCHVGGVVAGRPAAPGNSSRGIVQRQMPGRRSNRSNGSTSGPSRPSMAAGLRPISRVR